MNTSIAFQRNPGQPREFLTVGTTFIPSVSFRRKATLSNGATNNAKAYPSGFDVSIAATNVLFYELRAGTTLTGAIFVNPLNMDVGETGVEVDRSATAVAGGRIIYSGLSNGAGSDRVSLVNSDMLYEANGVEIITLVVKVAVDTSTVHATLRWWENWL